MPPESAFYQSIAASRGPWDRERMMITAWKTSSAGILPAVPRASRPRRGGRGRPPDSRRDGGATLSGENSTNHAVKVLGAKSRVYIDKASIAC
jgi:hypothetical protein